MNSLHWIYTSYRDEEENCAKQGKFVSLGLAGISSSETLPEGRYGGNWWAPQWDLCQAFNAYLETLNRLLFRLWPKAVSSLPSPPISDPYN